MIRKQDILDRAREWQLRPDIVEKDYVLGWLLAAIAQQEEAAAHWVFKGGTCLKKCYFETYRFSEDLDFTLLPEAGYDAPLLTQTLLEVGAIAHELSGITFPEDAFAVIPRRGDDINEEHAHDLFRQKCEVKGIPPPSSETLLAVVQSSGELRADWEHMLAHQLPVLPPFETQLIRLAPALRWIDAALPETPTLPRVDAGSATLEAPAGATFWGLGVPLEVVRFAGVNRLLVEFTYHGKARSAEPYSLRRTQAGNLVLYAWEVGATHIKAFTVAEIRSLLVTTRAFDPRYQVEFSPAGGLFAPAITRTSSGGSWRRGSYRRRYVFRCGMCQKLFRHTTNESRLRPHTSPSGSRCSNRRGHLERTD